MTLVTGTDLVPLGAFDPDLDLSALRLDWVSVSVKDIDARGALTGLTMERTIEGASTVTVTLEDPDSELFADAKAWAPAGKKTKAERDVTGARIRRPTLRGRAMEVELDGIVFRLVQVSKSGTALTLTLEDRIIYWLRRKHGERRVPWNEKTRAQFILSLLREVKTERPRFVCPELNVKQPREKVKGVSTAKGGGLSASGLKVRYSDGTVKPATGEQRRIGQRALDVANRLKAGPKATLALMEACMVESNITNTPKGTGSSVGILQLLSSHGSVTRRMDVEWCVDQFLTKGFTGRGGAMALAKSSLSAGRIAQAVQGSAYPDRYDKVRAEAQGWIDAYGGSGAGGNNPEAEASSGKRGKYGTFQYAREGNEDSWTTIQRLAGEVNWRCFMLGRAMYYMSEEDLFRRQATYRVTPDDPAILDLDYDVDWGKPASELQLRVVLGRWKCPPGSIVEVAGYGPPNGRWLVSSWRRDYFNPIADVTLRQPARELLEPAQQASSGTGAGLDAATGSGASGLAESTSVMKAYRRADAIDRKHQHYKWGGGHGSFNDPGGYDCSGFVSSCLNAAGLLKTPMATGGLVSWGQSGEGQYMTVWVKETGAAHASHTFLVFNLKGKKRFAEAGGAESGDTGWHNPRSTAGFQPRHWPGT